MARPLFFSHVDEELAWREANSPSLDECPECHDPMVEQDGDKVCHGCGHKQKIIEAKSAGALALLPEAAGLLEGGGAAAAAGGAAEGGGGIAGIGGLMNKALQGGAFRGGEDVLGIGGGGAAPGAAAGPGALQPGIISAVKEAGIMGDLVEFLVDKMKAVPGQAATALTDPRNPISYADDVAGLANGLQQQPQAGHFAKGTFGEEEVGRATKNDGQNSDPDQQSSSGDDPKEFGDSPEQLKDIDGIGGPTSPDDADQLADQGDPALQEKALKAFHMNKPLILELANSDEAGSDNPILLALDAILEEAFPGYRGGTGESGSEHPLEGNNDEPSSDDASDDSKKSPASDDDKDKKESAYQTPHAQRTQGIVEAGTVTSFWTALGADDDDDDLKHKNWLEEKAKEIQQEEDLDEEDKKTAGAMGGQPPNQFGAAPSMAPGSGAPGVAGANPPCPMCGQAHMPGTPCPTDMSQNQPQPFANGAPISPQPAPNVVTTKLAKWEVVSFEPMAMPAPPAPNPGGGQAPPCPACGGQGTPMGLINGAQTYKCMNCGNTYTGTPAQGGAGEAVAAPAASGQISGPSPSGYSMHASLDDEFGFYATAHDGEWKDADGAPLLAGHKYDLVSHDYAIPDKITVDAVYPDKISYTIHASSTDPSSLPYHSELTRQELDTMGYRFVASEEVGDDDVTSPEEHPVRPGQDPTPQVDDLSTPSTVVSSVELEPVALDNYVGSFGGDAPVDRSWILEAGPGQGADVDPGMMAKLAGKDYSGQEQRQFIDESGTARNLDKLDLEGTHYLDDDLDGAFNW